MGIIDWIILAVLLIFVVQGFRRGLAAAVLNICGAIATFFLVGQLFPLVRNSLITKFTFHPILASITGVVLIVVMIVIILRLLVHLLNGALKIAHLGFINQALGMLFGFVHGLLIVIVVMVLLDYAPKFSTPLKDASKHRVYAAVDTLKEDIFTQLHLKQRDKYKEILDRFNKKDEPKLIPNGQH
jgi:membrane protein required for colicin V production